MEAACRKDRKDKRESREGAFPVNETRLSVSRGTSVPRGPPFPSVKSNSTLFGRIYIYLYIYIYATFGIQRAAARSRRRRIKIERATITYSAEQNPVEG